MSGLGGVMIKRGILPAVSALFALVLLSGPAAAAQAPAQANLARAAKRAGISVTWNPKGAVPLSVRGTDLGARGAYSAGRGLKVGGRGRYAEDAVAVLDNLSGLFRASAAAGEFSARRVSVDRLGCHHVRMNQFYAGLRVVGGELIVHFDKSGRSYEVNGSYVPEVKLATVPTIAGSNAVAAAQADLAVQGLPQGVAAGSPELVVLARRGPARLAYELTLTYGTGSTMPGRWRYWMDAGSGAVLERYNDIQTIPAPTSNGSHSALSGAVLAGEGGGVTNVTGWYDNVNANYYLYNTNLHWVVENVAASGYPDANTYAFRPTNDWGTSDRSEMSAAQAFELTQRYYNQVHGLNSFNTNGILARANVHQGTGYVNAYWDGSEFYFGDGDDATANSLAVLDVAGHEFTHAVTEYSANLVYQYEPGALNESFSDIFGSCIEFFGEVDDRASYPAKHAGMADWLCGEDCWLESTALRDLRNPANPVTVGAGNEQPTRYLGTYWYAGSDDNGGVHQNSGVQNFFFYLLCEGGSGTNDGIYYGVTGIGITNAQRVAYRALTVYCTADTDYRAARAAWLSAATDLNPAWASSVSAAWDAVGVQIVYVTSSGDPVFSGSEGGPFSPSTFVYTITNENSEAVGWGVSHTQTWATVAPGNGSISAFGSQAVTVTVNGAASELSAGTYVDTLVFTNSTSAFSESRSITLLVLPPAIYSFDLSTNPGWTMQGEWAFGHPTGQGGALHGYPDPNNGFTGANVFGVNLSGDYSTAVGDPCYLTAGPLDFSNYTNVWLDFRRWLNTDYPPYVYAMIEASTNGSAWTRIWTNGVGVEIAENAWNNAIYSLGAFADGQSTVYIRWGHQVDSSGAYAYAGWNIDDICFRAQTRDAIRVSPDDGFTSQGYEGGPFSPTSKTYSVVNGGTNAFDWTASTTSTWFSVSLSGGSLAVDATASVSVALNPSANAFVPGEYHGAVIFSNSASGFTLSRAVELTVLAIPGEIGVTDSLVPDSDLSMPFGDVIVGLSRTESLTITNSDDVHPIILSRIHFGFYLEDFSDGLAQDWSEDVDANWNVVSGEYQAQSVGETWMISMYGGKSWNDVTAQMTCRRTGGAGSSAALLLRATANFDEDVGSAYVFQISGSGSYGVWKQVAGTWSWLQSWTTSPEVQPDVNVLRATAQGAALSFYINGTLVWSGSDSSLSGGLVGLGGYTSGDTTHYFDDVMAGEALLTTATVSETQAALNIQPFSSDDYRVAPAGTGVVPCEPASVGAEMIVSGVYRITNEPATFPYSIPAHSSITFHVIYTPTAIASNEGEVVIESNDTNSPEIRVALSGRGILDYFHISPSTGFVSSGHWGGPFTPTSLVYSLTNSSGISIDWAAANTQTWVTVAPVGGTLDVGAAQSVTVSINVAATSLVEGVYQDTVVFSNKSTGICHVRPVTLTVFTSPQIGVAPAEIWVTNKIGQSQTNVLIVSNGALADGTLTFSLSSRNRGQTPLPFGGDTFASRIESGHDLNRVEPGRDFVPGELLVRFAGGVTASARASLLSSLGGGTVQREYHIVPGLTLIRLPAGADVENSLDAFNRASGVVYAAPNYVVRALDTYPDDALFPELWGMNNTGQLGGTVDADIDAPAAWDMQTGGTGIVVGVIDTGIDYNHEDLSANMWVNPGEIPGNLLDDDGNGYTDDVHGINAILKNGDPLDDHDHGTHCAGTIGGFGNNGVGVAGVNWRVRLMALKFLDSSGNGSTADAITCIEYGVDKGARVLSNSWGGGGYEQALKDAIDAAGEAGILFAAAAGNDNANNDTTPNYPSNYESTNMVAVMATDRNDVKSTFSSYGQTTVDLAAPGTSILSCKRGGGYQTMSGTSMATPHVAGAAALLMSFNPYATVEEIKQAMMSSVDVLFPTLCVSGGRLNLERAVSRMNLPWLTLDPAGATNMPMGSSTNVQVGFHAGALSPASYNGEIVVSCNDLTKSTVLVPVHMTVLSDDMAVSPDTNLVSVGFRLGPFTPSNQTYVVSNLVTATSNMTWTASASAAWVTVSPTGSTLLPGRTIPVNVLINDAAASFAVGAYPATVIFSNVASGVVETRTVELTVRGDVAFDSATYTVGEAGGEVVITVRRDGNTNLAMTVDFATSNRTATAGSDYVATNGTFTFAAGETVKTFTVQILDDILTERNETVNLALSNPTGGGTLGDPSVATLTIVEDDVPTAVYLRSSTGAPWDSTNNEAAMDRVFGDASWRDLRYETVNPTNLFSTNSTFIFMEGSDYNASELEAFLMTNSNRMESWVSAGGRLFLNAAPNEGDGMSFGFGVTLIYTDVTAVAAAVDTNHAIFRTPFVPAGNLWSGNSFGHATVSGSGLTALITNTSNGRIVLAEKGHGAGRVLFGGMTTANFHSPQPQADDLRANIIAYGGTQIDMLSIIPDTHFASAGYPGGPFSPSKTVYTLTNTGSTNLAWTAGCASNWVSLIPGGGTLPAGATADVTMAINANANELGAGVYNAIVAFSNGFNGVVRTRIVELTVRNDIAFDSATYAVGEAGGEAVITVRRDGTTNLAVTVDFAASNATATAGSDYVATNGTLTFVVGETVKTFAVQIVNDTLVEAGETVNLVLSNPTGGGTLGNPSVATLTILDDDGIGVSMPYGLYDGSNYLWDIEGSGYIINGMDDAYDGGHVLSGFSTFTTGLLVGARQIVLGPMTTENVRITRKIYVPADHAFCRFLEVLENLGASLVTNRVRIDTDLGSDSETIVDSTSSGDVTFEANDDWIVTDDADGSGDPAVTHVIANAFGQQRASAVSYSAGYVGYEYHVVLNPGEAKIVMHFGAQRLTRITSRAIAEYLVALGDGARDDMTAEEFAQVVNLGIPSGGDADGDGIPDDWENAHGLNPLISNSPMANADSDWMTDMEEYISDTDPTNELSCFQNTVLTDAPMGAVSLVVDPTSTARVYGVHATTNLMLAPQLWILYPPETTGSGSGITFTITNRLPSCNYRTSVRLP